MEAVFTENFVNKVGGGTSKSQLRKAVEDILEDPLKHDGEHHYPWGGHFEKKRGVNRVVYGICGECRKSGCDSEHPECTNNTDDTVVFRTIYTVL